MDRPILMSAPMVRGLLDDRKTNTRRVIKPKNIQRIDHLHSEQWEDMELRGWELLDDERTAVRLRFTVGDRLWVRETGWERPERTPRMMRDGADTWERFYYDADGLSENETDDFKRWGFKRRPGIHMPRWASRLTLVVTAVKVERLQEISEEDAKAEGIEYRNDCWGTWNADGTMRCGGSGDPREAYRCLWININGPGSWESNPWVASIHFRVHKVNIDAMKEAA